MNTTHIRPRHAAPLALITTATLALAPPTAHALNIISHFIDSYDGTTFVRLDDFDPNPMDPDSDMAGDSYTADNQPTTYEESDKVDPATDNGVDGGGKSEFQGTMSDRLLPGGGLRILANSYSGSSIVNTGSSNISMGARTLLDVSTFTPLVVEDNFALSGAASTAFGRAALQNEWGYSTFWDTGGSINTTVNSFPDYTVDFLDPTTTPSLPTEQTTNTTPFYNEFAALPTPSTVEISIASNTEARIADGFMPPQGDVPEENWPTVWAGTYTVINLNPLSIGDAPETPIEPEPAEEWDLPTLEFLENIKDALGVGFTSFFDGIISSLPLPDFADPTITDATSTAPASLAVYIYMPDDAYYQAPYPDHDAQHFMTPPDELILAIDDFQNLDAPVNILADATELGPFNNGDSLDFVAALGHGVNEFQVLPTAPLTNPYVMRLNTDTVAPFIFATGDPIPEPATLAMLITTLPLRNRRRATPVRTHPHTKTHHHPQPTQGNPTPKPL